MERYFILGQFNTWYDWRLILTAKDVTPPEPKTNYVELDGMSGTLDLSEALTGEVVYHDRTISATFWTDEGKRVDREALRKKILTSLHGKKIKIIEPDDPEHYFYGRVAVKDWLNNLAYAQMSIEAVCEPWRYALEESVRTVNVTEAVKDVVIHNHGVKTLIPTIIANGTVTLTYDNITVELKDNIYKISDIKLRHGVNILKVSGTGSVTFTYREADL